MNRSYFAQVSFLDVADYDYIAGRLLYRDGLVPQAMMMFQQAIEKYLKAALLYNSIPQSNKKYGKITSTHSLEKLMNRLGARGDLNIKKSSRITLLKFEGTEDIRYRTESYGISDTDNLLPSLDIAIVDLRRYCSEGTVGTLVELTESDLDIFKRGYQLMNRPIGKILRAEESKKNINWMNKEQWLHREILTWNNGSIDGREYKDTNNLSQNSPFGASGSPEDVYLAVKDFVFLPQLIHDTYKQEDMPSEGSLRWPDQYQRMIRRMGDVENLYNLQYNELVDKNQELEDSLHSLVLEIWHFKDWLLNDSLFTLDNKTNAIREYIRLSTHLHLAGDIANSIKHLEITNDNFEKREVQPTLEVTSSGVVFDFYVSDTNNIPMRTLTTESIAEWNKFLCDNDIFEHTTHHSTKRHHIISRTGWIEEPQA